MKIQTKFLTSLAIIGMIAMPSFAKIDGMVSKDSFYDLEKTIMKEVSPEISPTTEKFWEKNIYHANKYRPFCMLSNKELYTIITDKRPRVIQRFAIPAVYNVSLKGTSVTRVSISQPQKPKKLEVEQKQLDKIQPDFVAMTIYEQAKSVGVDSDEKINTAKTIKDTKASSSYSMALDLLNDVTKAEPYNALAFQSKGDLYLAQGDRENAIKSYAQALKLNPYSKQSCLAIAKILENTNKDLAQKYYERANSANMQ